MPLWALVGPTAAGKSALGQALAERHGAHIISADAVAVYRGCTIGSAKPSAADRARVPHHLLDVKDAHEPFDARQFVAAAHEALAHIRSLMRPALLVGGTGLYIRALRLGLIEVPQDAALRASLEAQDAEVPGTSLRRLQKLDPISARSIDANNGHYLRRALEITLITGRPASVIRAAHGAQPPKMPMVLWWVDRDDQELKQRIHSRTTAMFEGGLKDEVQSLLNAGVRPDAQALRAVGYKEVLQHLTDKISLDEAFGATLKSTWNYVRRQRIWLRREERQNPNLVRRLRLTEASDTKDGRAHLLDTLSRLWREPLSGRCG